MLFKSWYRIELDVPILKLDEVKADIQFEIDFVITPINLTILYLT